MAQQSKTFKGRGPPLWGEQESRTSRMSLGTREGWDVKTSHCLLWDSNLWQCLYSDTKEYVDHWTTITTRPDGTIQSTSILLTVFPTLANYAGELVEAFHNRAKERADEQGTSTWVHTLAIGGHNPHIPFCQCLHHKAACCHWFSTRLNISENNSEYLKTS